MTELLSRRGPFPVVMRQVEVRRVIDLSPRMRRIVVGGAALEGFRSEGADDHVKLAFPIEEGGTLRLALPQVGPSGIVWPEGPRSPLRDYTPRYFDAQALELTLDFVLHGHEGDDHAVGPALRFARAAKPGDLLGVGGPRGSLVVHPSVTRFLLAADETGLPAIARRLEELPAGNSVHVFVALVHEDARVPLPSAADVELTWVADEGPDSLARVVAEMPLPEAPFVAWIGAESAMMRTLRDALLERGVPREHMRASGYWKRGVAEHHE